MKNPLKHRSFFLLIITGAILSFGFQNLHAQKKNKVRLSVQYVKIMDGEVYFDIKASSRIKRKNVKVSNIEIAVTNELEDEKIPLGKATTNSKGQSRFTLKSLDLINPDSTGVYSVKFSFKGNKSFKKAKKTIDFKDVNIKANIITKDSINYLSATLLDASTKAPLVDEVLVVQVQRLFFPLRIGKEFNNTDELGSIIVPVEKGIPGVDGNLIFEVVLNESDDYGTVKALVSGKIGIPIKDESTFDQRTMWSPRNKTPIFLLIFPNLLILGIWGIIIYLIVNLFKLLKL